MNFKEKAKEARRQVLKLIHKGGTSHLASNFSCIDIATVLYGTIRPEDEIVWSKGWAAATIYYFLSKQKKLNWDEVMETFPNAPYFGLAEPAVNGVHVAGGTMGHGLPVAAGMALARKKLKQGGIVHCIMSDGELNEGTTWETAMIARHNKLSNLRVWIDVNKWQAMGRTKEVLDIEPIENPWRGFGWSVARIDGHDYDALQRVAEMKQMKPLVVICDTVKGKGVSFVEDHLLFHYKHVSADEYQRAMLELA